MSMEKNIIKNLYIHNNNNYNISFLNKMLLEPKLKELVQLFSSISFILLGFNQKEGRYDYIERIIKKQFSFYSNSVNEEIFLYFENYSMDDKQLMKFKENENKIIFIPQIILANKDSKIINKVTIIIKYNKVDYFKIPNLFVKENVYMFPFLSFFKIEKVEKNIINLKSVGRAYILEEHLLYADNLIYNDKENIMEIINYK